MRKFILIILSSVFYFPIHGQVLYTENFDSHNIGNLSTDITGTVPGKGNWYTNTVMGVGLPVGSNTDYQIAAKANKGNILQIAPFSLNESNRSVFRTDLKTYWQQRTPGNNVLKFSYDLHTGNGSGTYLRMHLFSDEGRLITYGYDPKYRFIAGNGGPRGDFGLASGGGISFLLNGQYLVLPADSWVTLECYIDYDNGNVYFSIPSINYTIVQKTIDLQLGGVDVEGKPLPDDSPVRLVFWENKLDYGTYSPKIDNINISAQNTVPTLSVNEVLSNQFNLYPNPATNIVNISNSDNMFVNQVQVYDLSGKLVSTQNFNNESEIKLNVETLTSGTYLLHLQTDQGIAVKKLIKK